MLLGAESYLIKTRVKEDWGLPQATSNAHGQITDTRLGSTIAWFSLTHALSSYLSGGGLVGHSMSRVGQTKLVWLPTLVCMLHTHTSYIP